MSRIKIGIDPGHGGSDPGCSGNGILEKDVVLDISLKLKDILVRIGFDVVMSRDSDYRLSEHLGSDLSLRAGIFNRNNVDAVISIHINSWVEPRWGGETHTYNGNDFANYFGDCIQDEMISSGLMNVNRGRKFSDFAILRETNAVAALVEMGFINSDDIYSIVGHEFEWAEAIARGISRYFEVSYGGFVVPNEPVDILYDMPILGEQYVDAKTMAEYSLSKNPNPQLSVPIEELASIFLEEGAVEGVRGDIAFCQSMIETGYFKYGNLVVSDQNNYAGLGATNNSSVGGGAWFKTAREGVRAQIQHLKGYASTELPKNDIVDPRYNILKTGGLLGRRNTWKSLSGSWAYPGYDTKKYSDLQSALANDDDYGSRIIKTYVSMKNTYTPITQFDNPSVPNHNADIWERICRTKLPDGSTIMDGTRPNEPLTRLEAALLIDRFINNGMLN